MFVRFSTGLLFASAFFFLLGTGSAVAQWENLETVEGPYGEETTLTKTPHSLADGLSARALGIASSDTTRWAISLIGAAPDDEISLTHGGEALSILAVNRPTEGVGPTKVFVSQETFLTMAESAAVTLRVGDRTLSLPAQLRREMKKIFGKVS